MAAGVLNEHYGSRKLFGALSGYSGSARMTRRLM